MLSWDQTGPIKCDVRQEGAEAVGVGLMWQGSCINTPHNGILFYIMLTVLKTER